MTYSKDTYAKNFLVAIDQLGNAIAGGNPDCTISGRTGYFAQYSMMSTRWYWITLQAIINFAFYPFDGPGHCYQAYQKEQFNEFYELKTWRVLALFVLSLITIPSCVAVSCISWPIHLTKLSYNVITRK